MRLLTMVGTSIVLAGCYPVLPPTSGDVRFDDLTKRIQRLEEAQGQNEKNFNAIAQKIMEHNQQFAALNAGAASISPGPKK